MKTDFDTISVEMRDGVAVLTMNNPPVNQLSPNFSLELNEAFNEAWADDEVKAVVLTGTGRNFIAGADITEIYAAKDRDAIFEVAMAAGRFTDSIETGPKPVVAAINGNALGGGLEMALACHYRVAAKGVNVGLPEVQIGVIPGGGGTQRLPRLIGLANAVEMITTGMPIKSEKAFDRGLVDQVVEPDQLIDAAVAAAQNFIKRIFNLKARQTRNMTTRLPSFKEKTAFIGFSRQMAKAKAKGYLAPFKALDAMGEGLTVDIEKDLEREIGYFADCAVSDVAKNLMGIFLGSRSAGRLPRIKGIQPAKIKKAAMLGGGVMGSGIVNLLISNGYEAVLWDINDQALEKGVAAVRKTYDYPIKKRKMTVDQLDGLIDSKLTTTTNLEDLKDVDLVIEAVLENMEVKQDIWLKLEKICRDDVVFGTNTSALPITEMASVLKDPSRMIGLHFFNPAHRMQLLEIICAEKTSDQTLASSVAFARSIKKIPIVVNDGPGFYVSRQLGGLMGGSVYLLADGVPGADIEMAMMDFGLPMGPATLSDLTGIDIGYHVNRTFERKLGDRYKIHPLTVRIYETSDYGRKTGAGYMDYSGPQPVPNPRVAKAIADYLAENKVQPKKMSNQEIVDAMLGLAINEAALMMEQGICDRPLDMDLAMIFGTGFPPYRGGVFRYADKWGLANVLAKLEELEKQYGPRFAPAELIRKMAAEGKTFYE